MATKSKGKKKSETPLMQQYTAIKTKHPNAMLLFRVGDFYETFGADAIKASNILGIVLTARNNGGSKLELAGFPYHSLDTYLPKLVRAGQRVAICEQLEDPKKTKQIVKRGVTELVTPGVSYNDNVLEHKKNNFLAVVHFEKNRAGIAFLDVSTGEFMCAEGSFEYVDKLLQSFAPSEVLYQRDKATTFKSLFGSSFHSYHMDEWVFTEDFTTELLLKHFQTKSLKGFGIAGKTMACIAAGGALHYLSETQHHRVKHISNISRIEEEKYVWLDRFTIRNLELFHSPHPQAKTLVDVIDHTLCPMGSRLLKRWIALPLKDIQPIKDRLEIVDWISTNAPEQEKLQGFISQLGDLERLISKVAVARINPKEVIGLNRGLKILGPIKDICDSAKCKELNILGDQINLCIKAVQRIETEIFEEAPVLLSKGHVINEGVFTELDELRKLAFHGKDVMRQIKEREVENTGISSLKIGFNNVFGYYLEVTHAHKDKVPEAWIRKQTLVNAERYITEELKEYESKILGAEEKIGILESRLFNDVVLSLMDYISPIQTNAAAIAKLDCLTSFAIIAKKNNYVKPEIHEGHELNIVDGRHPVIEKQLPVGETYVANDVYLDNKKQQIIVVTGPNMAGKSALLRQTALISLMAQIGSYVPAQSASIGLIDKIFTRVGASDNISLGESTFMVEMNETASILNNLSDRSLVILDEIGRGTSTYDGISIAWAIAEYIHEHKLKAKTLFATHYHELNDMSKSFKRIKNFNVAIKEINNKIIFLRKLVPGGSEHSFGIHVAKMAGMPQKVLKKANAILAELEATRGDQDRKLMNQATTVSKEDDFQLSFFQLNDPVLSQIKEEIELTDINNLTPVEALMKLNDIKKLIGSN